MLKTITTGRTALSFTGSAVFACGSLAGETKHCQYRRHTEIDFIIQRDGKLIPIEVKAADNTRAKSLKVYMDTYHPEYAIKLSAKNFGFEDNKKIVPLYAVFCV